MSIQLINVIIKWFIRRTSFVLARASQILPVPTYWFEGGRPLIMSGD